MEGFFLATKHRWSLLLKSNENPTSCLRWSLEVVRAQPWCRPLRPSTPTPVYLPSTVTPPRRWKHRISLFARHQSSGLAPWMSSLRACAAPSLNFIPNIPRLVFLSPVLFFFFLPPLQQTSNVSATLVLSRPIKGPRELVLDLEMVTVNNVINFRGSSIIRLTIYVSEHPFWGGCRWTLFFGGVGWGWWGRRVCATLPALPTIDPRGSCPPRQLTGRARSTPSVYFSNHCVITNKDTWDKDSAINSWWEKAEPLPRFLMDAELLRPPHGLWTPTDISRLVSAAKLWTWLSNIWSQEPWLHHLVFLHIRVFYFIFLHFGAAGSWSSELARDAQRENI